MFSLLVIHQSELNATYLLATRGRDFILESVSRPLPRTYATLKSEARFTLQCVISATTVIWMRAKKAMECKKVTGTLCYAHSQQLSESSRYIQFNKNLCPHISYHQDRLFSTRFPCRFSQAAEIHFRKFFSCKR